MRRERSLMYARKKQPGSTWSPYMHELRNSCAASPRLLAYDIAEPCTSTIRCGSTAESVTVEVGSDGGGHQALLAEGGVEGPVSVVAGQREAAGPVPRRDDFAVVGRAGHRV